MAVNPRTAWWFWPPMRDCGEKPYPYPSRKTKKMPTFFTLLVLMVHSTGRVGQ